jgi:hypothetical protein
VSDKTCQIDPDVQRNVLLNQRHAAVCLYRMVSSSTVMPSTNTQRQISLESSTLGPPLRLHNGPDNDPVLPLPLPYGTAAAHTTPMGQLAFWKTQGPEGY